MSPLKKIVLVVGWGLLCSSCNSLKIVAIENAAEDSASDSGGDSDSSSNDSGTLQDTNTVDADSGTTFDTETVSDSDESRVCDGTTPASGTRSVDVGGVIRTYVLHVPESYTGDVASPLILDFHAIQDTGSSQLSETIYREYTDDDGVIMAFPDGLDGPFGSAWNIGPCCVDNPETVDDVAFARAIVADIMALACIDSQRVYAVGTIMGGGLANRLACEAADVFAAIVSSSFDLVEETVDDCSPERPISTLAFRGESDILIPFNGGTSNLVAGDYLHFLGAYDSFDRWAQINNCTGASTQADNGCLVYPSAQCDGGVDVMLCVYDGFVQLGDGQIAWDFLQNHQMP